MSKKLEKICLERCRSLCCFNGIDLSEEEAQRIRDIVEKHPELFKGIPEQYFITAQLDHQPGKEGLRFALKKHQFFPPEIELPARFKNTICVFSDHNRRCMLHLAAEKLNIPVSSLKPYECSVFPMMYVDGELLAPLTPDNKFRSYAGKDYPVNLFKYAPCMKYKPAEMSWEEYVGVGRG